MASDSKRRGTASHTIGSESQTFGTGNTISLNKVRFSLNWEPIAPKFARVLNRAPIVLNFARFVWIRESIGGLPVPCVLKFAPFVLKRASFLLNSRPFAGLASENVIIWRQFAGPACVLLPPVGVQDSTSRLPEPIGRLPEPIGRLPEPIGRLPEPIGRLPEPIGRLPEPIGRLPEPIGRLPEPIGRLPEPIGRLPESIGWLLASIGEVPDSIRRSQSPVGEVPKSRVSGRMHLSGYS
jgi:hypothetical protein